MRTTLPACSRQCSLFVVCIFGDLLSIQAYSVRPYKLCCLGVRIADRIFTLGVLVFLLCICVLIAFLLFSSLFICFLRAFSRQLFYCDTCCTRSGHPCFLCAFICCVYLQVSSLFVSAYFRLGGTRSIFVCAVFLYYSIRVFCFLCTSLFALGQSVLCECEDSPKDISLCILYNCRYCFPLFCFVYFLGLGCVRREAYLGGSPPQRGRHNIEDRIPRVESLPVEAGGCYPGRSRRHPHRSRRQGTYRTNNVDFFCVFAIVW